LVEASRALLALGGKATQIGAALAFLPVRSRGPGTMRVKQRTSKMLEPLEKRPGLAILRPIVIAAIGRLAMAFNKLLE
jgi:hypothetical protein